MASQIARRYFSTTMRRLEQEALKKEQKRNPETFILGGVMVAALTGAGFYFGRSPTGAGHEKHVSIAKDGMPWESDHGGKYKYHPGGDLDAEPKKAPSALNVVVFPDVKMSAELHDKYNKWGKDGYP